MRGPRTLAIVVTLILLHSIGLAQPAHEFELGDAEGVFNSIVEVPLTVSSTDPFEGLSAVFELDPSAGEIIDLRVDPGIEVADFVEAVPRGSWAALGVVRSLDAADVFSAGENIPVASVVILCGPGPEIAETSIAFVDGFHRVAPTTETLSNGLSIDAEFLDREAGLSLVPGTLRCVPGLTGELEVAMRVLDPESRVDAETDGISHVTVEVAAGQDTAEVTVGAVLVSDLPENETGAEAWSLSIVAEPCFHVVRVTTDHTVGAKVTSGFPGMREDGFEKTEIVDPSLPQNNGRYGVVSAVVLSTVSEVSLPPVGEALLLRITGAIDSSSIDGQGVRSSPPCHLQPLSESPWLKGSGEPVATVVTVNTRSRTPSTRGMAITLEGRETRFVRGDSDQSGQVDITDGVFLLSYLFRGGEMPTCLDAADVNDDGAVDISDASRLFGWLFLGFPAPPAPSPGSDTYAESCGPDPTDDSLDCQSSRCDP